MANSDPPVGIPPVKKGVLVITAGEKPGVVQTLAVDAKGKDLRLIVTSGDTRFEAPIDEGDWRLDIVVPPSKPASTVSPTTDTPTNLSDPPVRISLDNPDLLEITAGNGTRKLEVAAHGSKLRLFVSRGDARFEMPIDVSKTTIEIIEV
jgi:hypothetical protein